MLRVHFGLFSLLMNSLLKIWDERPFCKHGDQIVRHIGYYEVRQTPRSPE